MQQWIREAMNCCLGYALKKKKIQKIDVDNDGVLYGQFLYSVSSTYGLNSFIQRQTMMFTKFLKKRASTSRRLWRAQQTVIIHRITAI